MVRVQTVIYLCRIWIWWKYFETDFGIQIFENHITNGFDVSEITTLLVQSVTLRWVELKANDRSINPTHLPMRNDKTVYDSPFGIFDLSTSSTY
jgi:hypothetical protein